MWFTGLSGAGKSTLADGLFAELRARGLKVERLDGDVVRSMFPRVGFSRADRDEHIRRVGHMASVLERNGVAVVASFISPFAESRQFVRERCRNYLEVFLSTSLEVCENRDPKGLYKKARAGEIQNFTGVDDPYERPENPELEIDTENLSVEAGLARVLDRLLELGLVK